MRERHGAHTRSSLAKSLLPHLGTSAERDDHQSRVLGAVWLKKMSTPYRFLQFLYILTSTHFVRNNFPGSNRIFGNVHYA